MIFVYVTFPNLREAKKISRAILENKLSSCAVLFPVNSSYWWKNKIVNTREVVLILKTEDKFFSQINTIIQKMHSFDTPCILSLKIERANRKYLKWLQGVLND